MHAYFGVAVLQVHCSACDAFTQTAWLANPEGLPGTALAAQHLSWHTGTVLECELQHTLSGWELSKAAQDNSHRLARCNSRERADFGSQDWFKLSPAGVSKTACGGRDGNFFKASLEALHAALCSASSPLQYGCQEEQRDPLANLLQPIANSGLLKFWATLEFPHHCLWRLVTHIHMMCTAKGRE